MAAPIYLYTGPEFGERNEQVASIKASQKKKYGEVDEYLLYASDSKIEDVVAKLQTESLFDPATCIVLREAEVIKKKDEIELISAWLNSAAAKSKDSQNSSILILVSDEISVDSKLSKLVPKENQKIFWEISGERLGYWLNDYFRKNGFGIEPGAVDSILDMIEGNTEALRAECSRFFLCFEKGHVINEDDVEQILAHNREETAFTLFDSMADASSNMTKRLETSLQILDKILMSKNNNAVMLLAGLSSCFRKLQLWHSIHAGNSAPDLKSNGFTSKKSIAQYTRASRIWNFGQTAAILALVAQCDMEIRSGGQSFVKNQLALLLYEIIMKGGAKISVYEL